MEHHFICAADEFHPKIKFVNEMWQTDFTYFKIKGWGWYYLSTVIDTRVQVKKVLIKVGNLVSFL